MTAAPEYENTGRNSHWGRYLFDLVVPKDPFLRTLKELGARPIGPYQGRGVVGRPPCDPVMMFQMLFLSYLCDLSVRSIELFVSESVPAH